MERKLASIQTVRKLVTIPNADFIEIAWINDWTVVVKKGEFQENDLYIFDVYDINQGRYLMPDERQEFFNKYLPAFIKHVPVVNHKIKIFDRCFDLDLLQKQVTGESMNPGTVSEGRVFKSCSISGLSFKCISNEYLLKSE